MNEYSQMVADLAKPGKDIIASLTPLSAHTLHMAVGLSGEVAELKEHQVMTRSEAQLSDSTILEELGDIEFYLEGLYQSMGIKMERSGASFREAITVDYLVVAVGNMLDLVKKIVIYNKPIDLMSFVNQLSSVRQRLDWVYSYYGYTPDQARAHNMDKLLKSPNARYKEGSYSDQAAQDRADKADKA